MSFLCQQDRGIPWYTHHIAMKHTRYLESHPVIPVGLSRGAGGLWGMVRKEYDEHRMVVMMDNSNSIVMGY